jgi:hypothetical protein
MKKILFTLCLAAALTGARGQIYIDSYRFGVPETNALLLDSIGGYPNAAAAYSFRKLRTNYTGNCISIQKDNGDTLAIGFSNNFLDTASVISFCGTGAGDSCRVRSWYDQSGNSNTLANNSSALQPLIMINGAINYNNQDIVLKFDGVNDVLNAPGAIMTTNDFTKFIVGSAPDTTSNIVFATQYLSFTSNRTLFYGSSSVRVTGVQIGTAITYNASPKNTNQHLFGYHRSGSNVTLYYDGSSVTTGTNSNAISDQIYRLATFTATAQEWFKAQISEIVIYNSSKSSDITNIQNNINNFYSIY